MKKLLLAGTIMGALAIPAYADTLTGTYTVTFSDPNTTATVTRDLSSIFTLTTGALRSSFITVNPGSCLSSPCNPDTAAISITFSNLVVNGHNFGGFTETGVYTAFYGAQTDNVVWNGAVDLGLNSPFGRAQDNTDAFVYTKTLSDTFGTLTINMIDGSDWNVNTWVEAGFTAAPVPGPLAGAGVPGIVAACFGMAGLNWKRRRRNLDLAA